ncbi:MAG: hypothetical protein ABIJ61_01325 [bacterium]
MRLLFQPAQISSLITGWRFYLALLLIFILATFVRVIYLDADPPLGITISQDFSTDPFAYVYFAKNQVEFGDANPYDDPRWPTYEISTQNYVALAVYSICGTGRAAGNLVGSLMNLIALLFIALAIKNFGSRWGAVFFLFFAGLNYTLIHFARTPFLEASQNFWLAASFYFFSLAQRKRWSYLAAGAACAAAAFFGKMLALFGGGIYIVALVLVWLRSRDGRSETLRGVMLFLGGYLAIALLWLLIFYLPEAAHFKKYLLEQGLGLYGAPRAFESLDWFLVQLNWFFYERGFLGKLPIVTALGVIAGALVLYRLLLPRRKKEQSTLDLGWLVLMIWTLLAFLSLFPHNYRPLRYQTTIMLPLMGLAGLLLANWITRFTSPKAAPGKPRRPSRYLLAVLWGLWFMPVLFSAFLYLKNFEGLPEAFTFALDNVYYISAVTFLVGFLAAVFVPGLLKPSRGWRRVGGVAVGLVVVAYAAIHLFNYASWVDKRQYDLITADRDLGAILAADAVISGSYATALTQENGLGCINHMFGVDPTKVDYDFFKRYPITHLVIDEGNESRARKDYPEIMSQAQTLATYTIRGYDVKLLRVAPATGNPHALRYQPTDFEWASYWQTQHTNDSASFYLQRYLAQGIPNYSADLALGISLLTESQNAASLPHLERAVEFAPRNVLARLYLGYAYLNTGLEMQEPAYYDSALVHLKYCRKFVSREQDPQLARNVDELEKR